MSAALATVPMNSKLKLLSLYSFGVSADAVEIQANDVPGPLTLRYGTSDLPVFEQVFIEQQYRFPQLENVEYVIDAGANIGLAAAYLLAKHPKAKLIAIEPDAENFAVAKRNLQQFGSRCRLVHGAVWPTDRELSVQRHDMGHWATQVSEEVGSETVRGFTIEKLMSDFDFPRIDFLKVDIEGAELQLFGDGCTDFMQKTQCCAVECHGPESESAFRSVCDPRRFEIFEQCELLVANRIAAESTR